MKHITTRCCLFFFLGLLQCHLVLGQEWNPSTLIPTQIVADTELATFPEQLEAFLLHLDPISDQGVLSVNPRSGQATRGIASKVYAKAAPAVVVVRTRQGHGTGFLVDPKGLILTNHHVIDEAVRDPQTGARMVLVHLGYLLKSGAMQLIEEGIPAVVLRSDQRRDLALLQLVKIPSWVSSLSTIKLSKYPPIPGLETVSIGHPAAGLLWSSRTCEVSGIGEWPKDVMNFVMARLATTGKDRQELQDVMGSIAPRKIVLSTCGINPGDSGGPLLNSDGELVAVTYAIPRGGTEQGISLDKFAYHIHLDEVREFLGNIPTRPEVVAPSEWPNGVFSKFLDMDKDKFPDTLIFYSGKEGPVSGIMVDATRRTVVGTTVQDLSTAKGREKFKFDFAIHTQHGIKTFYDTTGRGFFDLVLFDYESRGKVDCALRLWNGVWQPIPVQGLKMIDLDNVNTLARPRLAKIFSALSRMK